MRETKTSQKMAFSHYLDNIERISLRGSFKQGLAPCRISLYRLGCSHLSPPPIDPPAYLGMSTLQPQHHTLQATAAIAVLAGLYDKKSRLDPPSFEMGQ